MSGTSSSEEPDSALEQLHAAALAGAAATAASELSPAAMAMLELTSDVPIAAGSQSSNITYITDKSAYLRAGAAAALAELHHRFSGKADQRLQEVNVLAAIYQSAANHRPDLVRA